MGISRVEKNQPSNPVASTRQSNVYLTPISVNLPKDETILSKHTKSQSRARVCRLQHNIWIFSFQTKKESISCVDRETLHKENDKSLFNAKKIFLRQNPTSCIILSSFSCLMMTKLTKSPQRIGQALSPAGQPYLPKQTFLLQYG